MASADSSDLVLRTTDRGDDSVFARFFHGYDRAFVLPDEKEDEDGLRACLALNHGDAHAALTARYGPFRELCLVAETPDGATVGGANLIALPSRGGALVTANLNYLFVDPAMRGRGHLRRLVTAIRTLLATLFERPAERVLVFIEQNDPFAMSEEAYDRDTRFTGLDQFDRLRMWSRLGARIVGFDYRQPALVEGGRPDDTLILSVLGAEDDALDAAVLRDHLRRFFGISVLKGRPLEDDACARAQLAALAGLATVALLDPAPLLDRVAHRADAPALLGAMPPSFRAALAALPR